MGSISLCVRVVVLLNEKGHRRTAYRDIDKVNYDFIRLVRLRNCYYIYYLSYVCLVCSTLDEEAFLRLFLWKKIFKKSLASLVIFRFIVILGGTNTNYTGRAMV